MSLTDLSIPEFPKEEKEIFVTVGKIINACERFKRHIIQLEDKSFEFNKDGCNAFKDFKKSVEHRLFDIEEELGEMEKNKMTIKNLFTPQWIMVMTLVIAFIGFIIRVDYSTSFTKETLSNIGKEIVQIKDTNQKSNEFLNSSIHNLQLDVNKVQVELGFMKDKIDERNKN